MLTYCVEWHMRQKLAPMLFDDDDKETALASRESPVAQARKRALDFRRTAADTHRITRLAAA